MDRNSFIVQKLGSVRDIMLPSAGDESVGLATSETLTVTFHGCQHTDIQAERQTVGEAVSRWTDTCRYMWANKL